MIMQEPIVEILPKADFESVGQYFSLLGLGLVEFPEKAISQTIEMEFLGSLFNTVDMTLSVTPDPMHEIQKELDLWLERKSATKKQLQSL